MTPQSEKLLSLAERAHDFGRMRTADPAWRAHHEPLIRLYHRHLSYKCIARELGRTPDGVRGSVRKLKSLGVLGERVEWPVPQP